MKNFCWEMLSNAECFQGTRNVEPALYPPPGAGEDWSSPLSVPQSARWRPGLPSGAGRDQASVDMQGKPGQRFALSHGDGTL